MSYSSPSSDSEDELPARIRGKRMRLCDVLRQTSDENVLPETLTYPSIPEISQTCTDVYTGCVSKTFSKLRTMKMGAIMKDLGSDSDEKDEEKSIDFIRKENRPRRGVRAKKSKSESSSSSLKEDDASIDCVELGSDSESDLDSSQGSLVVITPPPSQPAKRGRRATKVTRTMDLLDQASQLIGKDNEADISIVSVSPSPKQTRHLHKITVKIRSRSGVQRFPMAPEDSFSCVIKAMARHEGVDHDFIHIYLNEKLIEPFDTPGSLGIGVADILECLIKKPTSDNLTSTQLEDMYSNDPNYICLKVQGRQFRSQRHIWVNKREPLGKLMNQYCKGVGVSFGQLAFKFDGEDISPTDTAEDLDLETDFCIDVIDCK